VTTEPSGNGSDKADPIIGTLIDRRYRVLGRIGDGGMGIVYKVEHTYLNKLFAIKVMRPTRDAVDRQRFEQEAQLASKIRHKNVVEISDFGVLSTGQPYFVMEFLRGHTLGDAIFEGRIDPLLACHIAAQIASGLGAVHKQNVVHRDLKPDNIFLIDPDEQAAPAQESDGDEGGDVHFVKIMDFGIAKSIDKNLTGTGMTLGTPEYMSPEQATGEKVDWRSDQYSLGCILYEMLTGELPFTGRSAFEVMNQHLNEPPVAPRQRRPELAASIPAPLEKLVLGMMQKKPSQRYPSMRAVEQGLRDVVAALRQAPPAPVAAPPPAQKTLLLPRGQPNAPLLSELPQAPETTLRNGVSTDDLDRATKPLMPALRPSGPPPAAPTLLSEPKTLVLGGSVRGQLGAPLLLDKLAVKVKVPSLPELPRARLWERSALLRWLYGRLRALLRLFLRRG